MRTLAIVISFSLFGCATQGEKESAANSTASLRSGAKVNCDRPTTVFPREALYTLKGPVRTSLRFKVLESGSIDAITVKSSSGQRILDDAVIAAIQKMKCDPLPPSEQPVWLESWYEFNVK